ncbi:MAG: hypothetical protein CL583_17720 [Alteromonadaceae bacterium]|nr:hypothetical protein [Alteromonadaceae bacterium]|tara:strand:+ start:890 stop:1090 length:201 start_codon:yes stop_codon:yes gene_type:complete
MTDDLFSQGITHIDIKCWDCEHMVTRRPGDVPDGIAQHEFERRSVCKCGTGWPRVSRYPRKAPTSM